MGRQSTASRHVRTHQRRFLETSILDNCHWKRLPNLSFPNGVILPQRGTFSGHSPFYFDFARSSSRKRFSEAISHSTHQFPIRFSNSFRIPSTTQALNLSKLQTLQLNPYITDLFKCKDPLTLHMSSPQNMNASTLQPLKQPLNPTNLQPITPSAPRQIKPSYP